MGNRILVVGAGPIGAIIGGRLARAGHDITFVDVDSTHVTAIQDDGLHVDVPDGPFAIRPTILYPDELDGAYDTALIAVRSQYTTKALQDTLPHLTRRASVVSMQNGLNLPAFTAAVPADRVIGMAIRMAGYRTAPGHVRAASPGHVYIGHPDGHASPRLDELRAALAPVLSVAVTDNIVGVQWSKLTFTGVGYFGSLDDRPFAASCADPGTRALLADFLAEVVAVGEAVGVRWIRLAEYDPPQFHPRHPAAERRAAVDRFARTWNPTERKGPLRHIRAGRGTEVDATLGGVVREGDRLGVPTPLCAGVAGMIRELQAGTRGFTPANYAELHAIAAAR